MDTHFGRIRGDAQNRWRRGSAECARREIGRFGDAATLCGDLEAEALRMRSALSECQNAKATMERDLAAERSVSCFWREDKRSVSEFLEVCRV